MAGKLQYPHRISASPHGRTNYMRTVSRPDAVSTMTAPGSWRKYPLEVRAKLSAERQDQTRWPRRWILFGPRIVPLETFLLAQMRTHQRYDKARKHWKFTVDNLMRGNKRRQESLIKASRYIQDLKDRLAQ